MVTVEDMFEAYYDCLKHKRHSVGAVKYFMGFEEDLVRLTEEVNSRTYSPSQSTTFVVTRPKPREVFAACFRDRIIHHYIALRVEPWFESIFGERTFNCRKGKGQLFGIKMLRDDIRKCSDNYTKDCYIAKFDLQGFFMSIDKELLCKMLVDYVGSVYVGDDKEDLLWLIKVVVMHNPQDNCVRRSPLAMWDLLPKNKSLFTCGRGKGVPIGNLSSQLFANFFLYHLDRFLDSLGFEYHGRYVDDFYIIHPSKEYILKCVPKIRAFLNDKLHITLHPKKFYIQHYSKGVTFTGAIVKYGRIYPAKRAVTNYHAALKRLNQAKNLKQLEHCIASVNSYLGLMIHYDSYTIRRGKFARVVNADTWGKIYVKGHFQAVHIRKHPKAPILAKELWPKVIYLKDIVTEVIVDENGEYILQSRIENNREERNTRSRVDNTGKA